MRVKKSRDTLQQSYLLYLAKNKSNISISQYKKICYAFNKELARLIVEEGINYILPYRLGSIQIFKWKCKYSKLQFDFPEYKKTGIKTFYINSHSNDYKPFVKWRRGKVAGRKAYQFKLTRDNNRRLASIFFEDGGYQRYEELKGIKKKKK